MAAMIGAPLFFSISGYMSETTANMSSGVKMQDMSQAGRAGFSVEFSKPDVYPDFLSDFSLMANIAINFFAGLIISEIKNGNIKEIAKYIPVLTTMSVTLFFVMNSTIGGVVGGFI